MGNGIVDDDVEILMANRLQPPIGSRRLKIASLVFLVLCSVCAFADSLNVADSIVTKDEIPLWSDTALAISDTLPYDAAFAERWLIPFGLLLVSGVVAVGLYAIRSK